MARALTLFLLIATGCCGPVRELYPPAPDAPTRDVYIFNNHWHTGFVLRYDELSPTLQRYLNRLSDANCVEIGWGDEGFYRAPKGTSGLAMQAMFWSRGSVLHVAGLTREPEAHYLDYHVDLYRIRVSTAGYERLMRFIDQRFAVNDAGDSIELQPGLYGISYFYAARGGYSAFHTCNNWVADGVRATGFPISPFYAQLAENVGWQIHTFGRKHQSDVLVLSQ